MNLILITRTRNSPFMLALVFFGASSFCFFVLLFFFLSSPADFLTKKHMNPNDFAFVRMY